MNLENQNTQNPNNEILPNPSLNNQVIDFIKSSKFKIFAFAYAAVGLVGLVYNIIFFINSYNWFIKFYTALGSNLSNLMYFITSTLVVNSFGLLTFLSAIGFIILAFTDSTKDTGKGYKMILKLEKIIYVIKICINVVLLVLSFYLLFGGTCAALFGDEDFTNLDLLFAGIVSIIVAVISLLFNTHMITLFTRIQNGVSNNNFHIENSRELFIFSISKILSYTVYFIIFVLIFLYISPNRDNIALIYEVTFPIWLIAIILYLGLQVFGILNFLDFNKRVNPIKKSNKENNESTLSID